MAFTGPCGRPGHSYPVIPHALSHPGNIICEINTEFGFYKTYGIVLVAGELTTI